MTPDEIVFKIVDLENRQAKYETKIYVAHQNGARAYEQAFEKYNPKLAKIIKRIELYKKVLANSNKTNKKPALFQFSPKPSKVSSNKNKIVLQRLYGLFSPDSMMIQTPSKKDFKPFEVSKTLRIENPDIANSKLSITQNPQKIISARSHKLTRWTRANLSQRSPILSKAA